MSQLSVGDIVTARVERVALCPATPDVVAGLPLDLVAKPIRHVSLGAAEDLVLRLPDGSEARMWPSELDGHTVRVRKARMGVIVGTDVQVQVSALPRGSPPRVSERAATTARRLSW